MEPPEILPKALGEERVLLLGSRSDLTANDQKIIERFSRQGGAIVAADKPEWLKQVQSRIGRPSVLVKGSHPVRAIVRDQHGRTIVHLLNLDVQRLSSFQDKVNPVLDLHLTLRVPFRKVRSVRALTADADGTSGALKFAASPEGRETVVETTLARLAIATISSQDSASGPPI